MGPTITIDAVDELLARLPALHVVAHRGEHRLVLGPPGAFVLGAAADGLFEQASTVRRLAFDAREQLAHHLAWVPFVESLVVTPSTNGPVRLAGTVPIDLALDVLVAGRDLVEPAALITVRLALRAGRLGSWALGTPAAAMIDLCNPLQPTTRP
jgi:hypothetical protein